MKLMNTLKKTGLKIEHALIPSENRAGDMDILDKIKQEHNEVSDLLDQLVETPNGAKRKMLLKRIKLALVPHVRAEEKIVYNAIIAKKDLEAKVDGEEGYHEHGLADKMLSDLGKIPNAASPEFTAGAKVLREIIQHHVKEEERNVWKDIKEYYDEDERIVMNRKFEAAKRKIRVVK